MKMARGYVKNLIEQLALFAAVIAVAELFIRLFQIPEIVLPAPSAIAMALGAMLADGRFYIHLGVTLTEIVGGFLIGSIAGLLLGVIVGLSPLMNRLLYPYIVALETMPKVAIAPIIVIWAGYGMSSKIIITALIAFFPLLANTVMGLRSSPREHVEMLIACTATRWQIFKLVQVKHALPHIFTGLNIAIVVSVIGAIVGEFVGAQRGLGYLILQNNFSFNMPGTFAILVILSVIGIVLHGIVAAVQRRVVFWMESDPIGALR